MNFYDTLSSEQLKRELVSRGIFDFSSTKKGMVDELKSHLCGVQRVPALLLLNPVTDLLDMNLITYTVLSFEPLHDLKGHVKHLLEQLPNVIHNPEVNRQVSLYLKAFWAKPKIYGSDLREAIIQVMHILVKCRVDRQDNLFLLISTIVKISEIVYSNDSRRCPKQCLQFYNCAFLHHILYLDMVKPQKCSIYFHSMLIHGPVQHELVCSRSVNTEAEERTFKQASNSAKNTDHKVDGFIEALLIRLQCKQMTPDSLTNSYNLTHSNNSRINKAAETLPSYTGSVFNKTFIHDHITAFQSHLERIAHFLIQGEGIWWYRDTDHAVHYCDSDEDPDSHAEGPHLLHV